MTESCLGACIFRVSCNIEFSHSSLTQTSLDSQFKMKIGIFFESQSNWLLCRVEEHQHQLAHQCSPNIIGIWEWGICGLMGGAFIT